GPTSMPSGSRGRYGSWPPAWPRAVRPPSAYRCEDWLSPASEQIDNDDVEFGLGEELETGGLVSSACSAARLLPSLVWRHCGLSAFLQRRHGGPRVRVRGRSGPEVLCAGHLGAALGPEGRASLR